MIHAPPWSEMAAGKPGNFTSDIGGVNPAGVENTVDFITVDFVLGKNRAAVIAGSRLRDGKRLTFLPSRWCWNP
jgi:hypothetical protein